jgi:2-polyprenyl-3-methyl-5-hydroxy-6-metoxy-1,4-benzoquinol methylase
MPRFNEEHAVNNGNAAGVEHERACARVAAHFNERWLRIYARRKLRFDPVFRTAFHLLRGSNNALIDVGCGVGLLAFYLRERNFQPPIIGFDRDGRKIRRARAIGRSSYRDLEFVEQDVCDSIGQNGNIVLFDLLHYLRPNEQARLLERLAQRVAPGGLLVIRDCPRDRNLRFWLTHLGERFAQITTWNVNAPLHYPTREKICGAFSPNEFVGTVKPLWGRTPLNNYLFIFRRRAAAAVPAMAAQSDSLPAPAR